MYSTKNLSLRILGRDFLKHHGLRLCHEKLINKMRHLKNDFDDFFQNSFTILNVGSLIRLF